MQADDPGLIDTRGLYVQDHPQTAAFAATPADSVRRVATDRVLVDRIRARLAAEADPVRAPQMQAYMKSEMPYWGVPVPRVRAIVRAEAAERPATTVLGLATTVRALWRAAEYREERYAATAITGVSSARPLQTPALLPLYREMITTGAWWDHVDEVSHRIGALLGAFPAELRPTILAGRMTRIDGYAEPRSPASSTPRSGPTSRSSPRRSWRMPTTQTSSCARESAGPCANTLGSTPTGCAHSSRTTTSARYPGARR